MRYIVSRHFSGGGRDYKPGDKLRDPQFPNLRTLVNGHYLTPDGSDHDDTARPPQQQQRQNRR